VRIPRSLPALGLSIGVSAVAMVVFQPSATLAGASGVPGNRQPGSAGRTAAQVGARVLIDNLSAPGPSPRAPSATGNATVGSVTIALASLHLRSPSVRPHTARPRVVAVPVTTPAVTAPPVTAAPAPTPAPPAAPVVPPAAPVAPAPGPTTPSPAVWAELRECESGDNYAIDTGNGFYGAYQFAEATWLGLGYSGFPNQAAPAVQDQAAERLQAMDGWGPWPGCSAKLGL
jgi:hypothetical protein